MAQPGVDRLGVAGGLTIAAAAVWSREMRAAIDDFPGDAGRINGSRLPPPLKPEGSWECNMMRQSRYAVSAEMRPYAAGERIT
jgi:hypothetical protein